MTDKNTNKPYVSQKELPNSTQIVLFSGGRDSTLTASLLMMRNIPVYLVSANSGASIH